MTILSEAQEALEQVFLGNTTEQWLRAGVVFVAVFVTFALARRALERRRARWKDLGSPALELPVLLLTSTRRYVRVIVGLYFAGKILTLPPATDRLFDAIIVVGVAIQLGIWASTALRYTIERKHGPEAGAGQPGRAPIGVLMFVGQMIIWMLAALFALDNLGINITALVAGLGVGGIAIALSVQTILGDLFSSLSIAFDKPFEIGDTLRIDDIEGRVEHISVRSTRLRSVTGEQVIFSNADVLKSRVRNLGRMPERRVQFRLQVAYDNPPDRIEQVPALARRVIEAQPGTRFGQCHLAALGASALEFEVTYHVANRDDVDHPGVVDAVNRGMFRALSESGVRLAYPTQRVLVSGAGDLSAPAGVAAPAMPPEAPVHPR
jgi:small-conductance mechanosensitive channel